LIGLVSATTPILGTISSPGDVGISPSPFGGVPTSQQLDSLAAVIQEDVDNLIAANPSVDKIVLLSHMQQLDIERALAGRLSHVDIIMGGGSNTRLVDSDDRLRAGDVSQGEYPEFYTDLDGNDVALINTDGNYKYVGRLVIEFDEFGNLIPASYDTSVSGVYATDAQGVADLGGTAIPEVQAIADQIAAFISEQDGTFFGTTDVFLNGSRSGGGTDGVRTQETNLGNLTADANLALAKSMDPSVLVSIKNGGGIRASIGEVVVPPGATEPVRVPPSGNPLSGRPEGGISQNAILSTLAFNNGLSLLTLTKQELREILEHGVAASNDDPGNSPGRFPQVSGVNFSFDVDRPAGDRVVSAAIVDEDGNTLSELVRDGQVVGDPADTIRIVTLNFLADGGDGYPFPDPASTSAARVNLLQPADAPRTGVADFSPDGGEQDAFAEYLAASFPVGSGFAGVDTDPSQDSRIQNLSFRLDDVLPEKVRGNKVIVTNEFNSGVGSLRNALQLASTDPKINRIQFDRSVNEIKVNEPLVYSGGHSLRIDGSDVRIVASDSFSGEGILISTSAADLRISDLVIDGTFDASAGDVPANGIYVPVPSTARGLLSVSLKDVQLLNNGLFGLHIADQLNDSDASISLTLDRVIVLQNGIGALDYDGVRVDEGGIGDLYADIQRSTINTNGGDGLELDERGDGRVVLDVRDSTFSFNGFFNEEDLDDGLDIDEAGPGGIFAYLTDVAINDNFDEGLDLDEAQEGSITLIAKDLVANRNRDEGIKLSEEDEGGVFATLNDVDAQLNGLTEGDESDGIRLEEEGDGGVAFYFTRVNASGNGDEGIQITEEDEGSLVGQISRSKVEDNGDKGIQLEEAGAGNFIVFLERTSVIGNGDPIGIAAEQADEGFGFLSLFRVDLVGELDANGVRVRRFR
jgi:2',3'-cyclic-nucleotide 2'-phosphodiesterase (5'-nucleotidase family)